MANDIANDDTIRDTNTYTYPMEHPVDGDHGVVYQYINNLDAEVTIEVYASYDGDDWSDEVQIGSGTTISAGNKGTESLSDPWDRIRFKVTATTSPTSGAFLIKEHELN